MKQLFRRGDLVFLLLMLLCGLFLAAGYRLCAGEGAYAVVRVDGEIVGEYPLSRDGTVIIPSESGTNLLVIENGTARIAEASCPDGLCVKMGRISRTGQSVICLPHRVSVEIARQAEAEVPAEAETPEERREFFAMDTVIQLRCSGEDCEETVCEAEEEVRRLEALFSVRDPESAAAQLNRKKCADVPAELAEILRTADEICALTGGSYNITVRPLTELWGFGEIEERNGPPDEESLREALEKVGSGRVAVADSAAESGEVRVVLGDGQEIDTGGIAKGYASDRIMEIFRERGIRSGIVSLGGNVQCIGSRADGSPWRCAIDDPDTPERQGAYLGVLTVRDMAVVTSGGYLRYITDGTTGERYHHILDPATGYPADSGLKSVTVICPRGVIADALSTAVFVMGSEKGAQLWREYGSRMEFDLILEREDGVILVTAPIADSFETDRETEIIR